ncbi:MAG: glycosyltransferase family 4 protein, partial [Methylococcales bacterium]|nr:glycosyltransferase family 4 protein [Methylococcales bacterium]
MMFSLITFATQWGSKYGGINSFNTDFLTAFGVNYHDSVQVICIVSSATDDEIRQAKENHVILVKLPYEPQDKIFTAEQAKTAIDELGKQAISFTPEHTVWLGHDRISGEAAIAAVEQAGGRSALIHHMSYDAYEAFAEDSQSAYSKTQIQKALFKKADLVLAVGSLLQRALADMLLRSKEKIHLIIPGLADIQPSDITPYTFTAFLSGRLSDDAAKIKQGHLGVAGFAKATANINPRPKLLLRGVDFESRQNYNDPHKAHPEIELKQFAEYYADGVINLQALSFTKNRDQLYDDLKSASVALMPSWHEGFGLVAWEAIAAGVPLIVSQNSGVYEFLNEQFKAGLVEAIKVKGKTTSPFFHDDDLK